MKVNNSKKLESRKLLRSEIKLIDNWQQMKTCFLVRVRQTKMPRPHCSRNAPRIGTNIMMVMREDMHHGVRKNRNFDCSYTNFYLRIY
jgi:hypothetical protein